MVYVETAFSWCHYLWVLFISKTKDFKTYINIERVGSVKSTQTPSSPCTSSSFRPLEVLIFACRWQLTFSHPLLDDLHVKAYTYLCFKHAIILVTQTAFAFLWKTDVFLLLNSSLLDSSCRLDLERRSRVHCWNISIVFTLLPWHQLLIDCFNTNRSFATLAQYSFRDSLEFGRRTWLLRFFLLIILYRPKLRANIRPAGS